MPQIGKMIFFVKGDVIEKGFKHGQDTAQAGVRLLLSSNGYFYERTCERPWVQFPARPIFLHLFSAAWIFTSSLLLGFYAYLLLAITTTDSLVSSYYAL